jgi:hypothetical protein
MALPSAKFVLILDRSESLIIKLEFLLEVARDRLHKA